MQEPETETFFFKQRRVHKTPKRFRKRPEDLPQELRYAHLNPRVAAYLATKEKDAKSSDDQSLDDGLGNKSLLPQINHSVSLLRQRLDTLMIHDEDSQRLVFEEARSTAENLLFSLSSILYRFWGVRIELGKTLGERLTNTYKDLISEVRYVPREWQCLANKDAYLQHLVTRSTSSGSTQRKDETTCTTSGSVTGQTTSHIDDDRTKDAEAGKRPKVKMSGKLTDIAEDEEASNKDSHSKGKRKESSPRVSRLGVGRSKTRLERMKTIVPESEHSINRGGSLRSGSFRSASISKSGGDNTSYGKRHGGSGSFGFIHHDPDESTGKLSGSNAGYWTIINFQLSSKMCEEKGWIVHPTCSTDIERDTLLKWATYQLRNAIKARWQQALHDKETGNDRPIVLRYYGDQQLEEQSRYKRRAARSSVPSGVRLISQGRLPLVPRMFPISQGRILFMASVSDGSTTVFYPSGYPAIVMSRSAPGQPGFYTFVFSNSPDQTMLAVFTPTGKACCYHSNGIVQFLATEYGGRQAEPSGEVTRRWSWPPTKGKLSASVFLELNCFITFRCTSQANMNLFFSCQKETVRIGVGQVTGAREPATREELGHLVSGHPFMSRTAKEFSRPYRGDRATKKPNKLKKGRKSGLSVEIQKILDFDMDTTENDEAADRILHKLQLKIKEVAESWMDHYRVVLGISSPLLRNMADRPSPRPRNVASAKSSGLHVIIESIATQVPKIKLSARVPSAPTARSTDRSDVRPSSATQLEHVAHPDGTTVNTAQPAAVTFDDSPEDVITLIVPERVMDHRRSTQGVHMAPAHPTPDALNMAETRSSSSTRVIRSQSAPLRVMMSTLESWGPAISLCPVALRQKMLGAKRSHCNCHGSFVPFITDVEFDEFIQHCAPPKQLIVVSVVSTLYPEMTSAGNAMLEKIYLEKNSKRTHPCMQSRNDPFRIMHYDVATAAEYTTHTQPLIMKRHNVVPGMFLIYADGKLVFCDHIFNGYSSERKDFHKQMILSKQMAARGQYLPKDFHFSPMRGRHGSRAAWGGEIGGVHTIEHSASGHIMRAVSSNSLSNGDSREMGLNFRIGSVTPSPHVAMPSVFPSAAQQYMERMVALCGNGGNASQQPVGQYRVGPATNVISLSMAQALPWSPLPMVVPPRGSSIDISKRESMLPSVTSGRELHIPKVVLQSLP